MKHAEQAEKTGVDKPRWAAKLFALKVDREVKKGLLRNQNLSAQIKRIAADLEKHGVQLKDKYVAIDECKDKIGEYEGEVDVLFTKIEKGEARLAQCYSAQ